MSRTIETVNESEEEIAFSSSSSESEVEEIPVAKNPRKKRCAKPDPNRVTEKNLGEIIPSEEEPLPPRRKYQPRKPLTEEQKESRREALAYARKCRSSYAAQRKVEALKKEVGRYDIKEENDSSDSEDEIILTKRQKQQVLKTKKQEKE